MAQLHTSYTADAAQLRRDLCLAYDNQDEALLFSLSEQIDQIQLALFLLEKEPCISQEN